MIREIVHIDEEKCDGCGVCVPECHEGALQIIDGKARLVSDLMCDGLGACLGHCPQDAITIEKREAEPYDEIQVIQEMVKHGENTVIAHLKHLKDHNEKTYVKQAVQWLHAHKDEISLDVSHILLEVHSAGHGSQFCGCAGSAEQVFQRDSAPEASHISAQSQLTHWPVQMHLISPMSEVYRNADLLLAADCVAFSMGDFHQTHLKNKTLAIACPKLDQGLEIYQEKLVQMIDNAHVNTITVMIMQVPCCSGLLQLVRSAADQAERKVPVKAMVVSVQGEILADQWV